MPSLPSVLRERNLVSEWAERVWVMDERESIPLVYDTSKTGHLKCAGLLHNLAMTRVPEALDADAFLVSIRGNSRMGSRLGSHNAVGLLHAKNITQLLFQQKNVPGKVLDRPSSKVESNAEVVVDALDTMHWAGRLPNAKRYKDRLANAGDTHEVYDGMMDEDVWTRKLCCVRGMQDVRPFFRTTSRGMQTCFVTYGGRNQGLRLVRFKERFPIFRPSQADPLQPPSQCYWTIPLAFVSKDLGRRNALPLVQSDGVAWPGHRSGRIWLMDTMGSEEKQPHLFAVHVRANTTNGKTNTGQRRVLEGCHYLQGWRGNTQVVQFKDFLWITIVHRLKKGRKNRWNRLGRTYHNKVVLFQADLPSALPMRCLRAGPEATGRDLFQRRPAKHPDWPFVFVLGLVHLGRIRDFKEGEQHAFLVSGGMGDFQPVMKIFDLFVPRNLLQ
eukprot:scaffold1_cov375-Pavlova_lutheri.AAC.2